MDNKFKTKAHEDGKQLDLYYPERGQVYSLREIETQLYLRDSPSLGLLYKSVKCVMQNSHCSGEQMLAQPLLADSQWCYKFETDEWIPVFEYAGSVPVTDFLDIEPGLDYFSGKRDGHYWVTPKGLPREQTLADGIEPAPDATEPLPEIDTNYSGSEQRRRVEFVRRWCPLDSIEEAERKYTVYLSYKDDGQTPSVSRQYAGIV